MKSIQYFILSIACSLFSVQSHLFTMETSYTKPPKKKLRVEQPIDTEQNSQISSFGDTVSHMSRDALLISDAELHEDLKSRQLYKASRKYIGTFPKEAKFVVKSLISKTLRKKELTPMMIKIVGEPDTGKTTLIRNIAQQVGCRALQYREIDTSNMPSGSNSGKHIVSTIDRHYDEMVIENSCSIIAFTKEFLLQRTDLKTLREALGCIAIRNIAPLVFFCESTTENEYDTAYYDQIIRLSKPNIKNIRMILKNIFQNHELEYEEVTATSLEQLNGRSFLDIERIAERTMCIALKENKNAKITNSHIRKAIKLQFASHSPVISSPFNRMIS